MKKFLTLSVVLALILSLCSIPALASETTISVETPVAMTLVKETDGNYEYKVTANVTVSKGNSEVNILMFGNRDNSRFVSGDNVMTLTVEEIASDYNIYYINQETANADGKVTFDFNVIFPTPAANDLYYVRIGAMDADSAEELGLESLSVASQVFKVTLASDKPKYTQAENVTLTATAENVFGNKVDADISYSLTQNGNPTSATIGSDGIIAGSYLLGTYVATATAGSVTSNSVSFTVEAQSQVLKGDVDGNGKVSVVDAVAVLKHIARTSSLENAVLDRADFDGDSKINTNDVIAMLKHIARV